MDRQQAFEIAVQKVMDNDEDGVNTALLMILSTHCDVMSKIYEELQKMNHTIGDFIHVQKRLM